MLFCRNIKIAVIYVYFPQNLNSQKFRVHKKRFFFKSGRGEGRAGLLHPCHIQAFIYALVCALKLIYALFCDSMLIWALIYVLVCAPKLVWALVCAPKLVFALVGALVWAPKHICALKLKLSIYTYMYIYLTTGIWQLEAVGIRPYDQAMGRTL